MLLTRRVIPAGVTLIAALALTGSASQAGPVGLPATQQQVVPPIYALVYAWTEQGERITAAQDRLVGECMARLGFRYAAGRPATADDVARDRPTPFGPESLEPRDTGELPSENPGAVGEGYARALYGDPERRVIAQGARIRVSRPAHGCLAEAETRLLGSDRARWMRLRTLMFEAEEDALRSLDGDAALGEATARWRRCMREAGFDRPHPHSVLADLPADADLRAHPPAVADVDCKHRTGYLKTAYRRLAELQRRRLDQDPSLAADWTALLHRQDAVARDVLSGG